MFILIVKQLNAYFLELNIKIVDSKSIKLLSEHPNDK